MVFFATDFGQAPSQDIDFNREVKWDLPLLEGYPFKILNEYGKDVPLGVPPRRAKTSIAHELKNGSFDAVMISGYMARIEREGLIYSLCRGIPVLFRPEGNDESKDRSFPKRWTRFLMLSVFYRLIFRYLSVGEASKRHFLAHGGDPKKTAFTPYCVDNAFFSNARAKLPSKQTLRVEVGLGACDFVLMYCGKISPIKNCFVLPRIMADLAEKIGLGLLVVGSGVLQEKLIQEVSALKNVHVFFAGFQNQSMLPRFYAMADALILPSSSGETWGLVVNEGMNFGLPAIVSNRVGCRQDLVIPGETGAVFDLERPESCTEAVAAVFKSKEKLAVLSENCQARIKYYSVERCADGILLALMDVYQERSASD